MAKPRDRLILSIDDVKAAAAEKLPVTARGNPPSSSYIPFFQLY